MHCNNNLLQNIRMSSTTTKFKKKNSRHEKASVINYITSFQDAVFASAVKSRLIYEKGCFWTVPKCIILFRQKTDGRTLKEQQQLIAANTDLRSHEDYRKI